MIRKIIIPLQKWFKNTCRSYCGRLPQSIQRKIVFILLGVFMLVSFYFFGHSFYQIGKNDGKGVVIEHLNLLPSELIQLNKELEYDR